MTLLPATVGSPSPAWGSRWGCRGCSCRSWPPDVLAASRSVPTCVLVAVGDESERVASEAVADALRSRGISTEVAPSAAKFGKQIRHADRRGIPVRLVRRGADGSAHSVKDIRSGDQVPADPHAWNPPPVGSAPDRHHGRRQRRPARATDTAPEHPEESSQ